MEEQNVINLADDLIRQGVDEFRMAAAKTATGIIEQGLAVLKIKQGCEKKSGGTDFPDVAMRELGLKKVTAMRFAAIGESAPFLFPVGNSLPSESVSTIYHIARMDESTIADKIERGVINPTASRDQVLEQVRIQKQKTVKVTDVPEPDDLMTQLATAIEMTPDGMRQVANDMNHPKYMVAHSLLETEEDLLKQLKVLSKPERKMVLTAVIHVAKHQQKAFNVVLRSQLTKYNKDLQVKLKSAINEYKEATKKALNGQIAIDDTGMNMMLRKDGKRFLQALHPDKHNGDPTYVKLFQDFRAYMETYQS